MDERLEGRSRLPPGLDRPVEFALLEVVSSHHGLDASLAGIEDEEGNLTRFVWLAPADAPVAEAEPPGEQLAEIRVEGNRRVEPEAIKRALKNKEGRPFDATRTADDLRALWALDFFADVQLLVQRLPKGGVAYVVRVEERPAVREVRYSGNDELSKDDFKELVDLKPHSVLDLEVVRRNAKKIPSP